MKKLERLNDKLFDSLKENEMSQLSRLVGGYYTTATFATGGSSGPDILHHYETWTATNGKVDNLHDDSVYLQMLNQGDPDGASFSIIEDKDVFTEVRTIEGEG